MPTYNDWDSQSGDIRNSYSGRVRTWNNTPNFGTIPKDQRPVNGYSDRRISVRQEKFDWIQMIWDYTNSRWTSEPSLTFLNYLRTLSSVMSFINWNGHRSVSAADFASRIGPIEDQLVVKALVKIADAKVNLAVTYAEAHKTSDLILGTARRIDRAYRAFRKGDLKGVASNLNITPKKLHNSWLEYKYGWMPLLMDVKGAAEFFAQQHIVRPPRFTVSASESREANYYNANPNVPWGGPPAVNCPVISRRLFDGKVKVWCELSNPHLSELQQLGLTNPALVAWELVPFSFVFDWFISVGDWLTAMSALDGVKILRAFYSQVQVEITSNSIPSTDRQDASYRYVQANQYYEYKDRLYTRVPLDLALPSLPPVNTAGLNFPKLVTSLALLRGNYRGSARL